MTRFEPGSALPTGVVCLVGSAGALEPLRAFFRDVPASSGLAFLVLQHHAPDQPRLLPGLLDQQSGVPVRLAQDLDPVLADEALVLTAGMTLVLREGRLHVQQTGEDSTLARPGDLLLGSAAQCLEARAVGIVLSGSGQDGTRGLQAIKAAGGLTLAQTPAGAAHDSMPSSALNAGVALEALDPERMPAWILDAQGQAQAPAMDLEAVCAVLARLTGHDFLGYKTGTLERRVRRRMRATGAATAELYLKLLETSQGESGALLKELLIGVTGFFRDPDAFERLGAHLLPLLRPEHDAAGPLRIWVPGCATGEEAYSLAILVQEHLEAQGWQRRVQVFATDIDTAALMQAKAGLYPAAAVEGLAPERRRRWFAEEGGQVRVAKELRELCLFSSQNILNDPPFSSLHLVSCRNLFIYLQPSLQRRLVPLLHFALKPGGLLFLGSSEGLAAQPELFEALDQASRIYRRREGVPRLPGAFPAAAWAVPERRTAARPADTGGPLTFSGRFERMLMEEYVPASALVNEAGDVLYCAGGLARYLHPPACAPSSNLLTNTAGPLHRALRRLLAQAAKGSGGAGHERVAHGDGPEAETVRVTVRPVPGMDRSAGIFAVVLQREGGAPGPGEPGAQGADDANLLEQMDQELRAARVELQVTVEQLESTNEELRSSNEELQSSNEELQASQEELQSVNEELNVANLELQDKVAALDAAHADLQNLLTATDIATLFLDLKLRVGRFTPAATALFGLKAGDLGRAVADLPPRFAGLDLAALAADVLTTEEVRDVQVRTLDGSRTYLVQLRPYRAMDQAVQGVVATFVDCTEIQRANEQILDQEIRFRSLFENMVNAKAHCRMKFQDGRPVDWLYLSVNKAFREQGGRGLPGRWVSECIPGLLEKDPELLEAYGRVARGGPPERFELRLRSNGEWYDVATYHAKGDDFIMIFDRITGRKQAEAALLESETRYRGLFEKSRAAMLVIEPESGAIHDANPAAAALYGWSMGQLCAMKIQELNLASPEETLARMARTGRGESFRFQARHRCADGTVRDVEVFSSAIPQGGQMRLFSIIQDITDRLRAEEALRGTEIRMRLAMELSQTGGWEFDRETGTGFRTPEHARILGDPPGDAAWSFGQFNERLLPEDRDEVLRQVRAGMDRQAGWNLECRIRRQDGAVRWVAVRGGPLPGGDGRSTRMAGILQDITERKEAEADKRGLEAQVGHLQRLESIGRLAGGVAHDMNNILAAIMAVGSLLKVSHAGDPALVNEAETLLLAATRGRDLVKALRDFSRKELDSARDLDLNELVRQQAELLDRTTLKRIKVRWDLAPDLPPVFGEAGAIANALMNLASNACDAMPGGGELTLTTRNLGGSFAELAVQDTGEGMTPEVMAHALDPFFTTKPAGKGTGLGLSQVYGTVKAHGGSVDLQSRPGQGTRVALAFPLARERQAPPADAGPAAPVPVQPMRILVVDDEDLVRQSERMLLEAIGHRVRCAEGGQQALDLLAAGEAFDLAVLDLNMPDMDGARTLEGLRQVHPDLKVILATGFDDERIPRLLSRFGQVRILMKPFTLAEMSKVLAGWGPTECPRHSK